MELTSSLTLAVLLTGLHRHGNLCCSYTKAHMKSPETVHPFPVELSVFSDSINNKHQSLNADF